ncbi:MULTISPECIES: HD family hydrolase [unclassified Phyllobacterium]|uniref:HD family hydrolase n=1 Tax=unclassified Phyllobacterium TaxID=2638441 RepID=UPI000E0E09C8
MSERAAPRQDDSIEPEMRAWQRMLSGRRLDLLDPSPLDIEIEDIAQGLSRVARWNGQTTGEHAYSVAQHSLLVEEIFGRLFPQITTEQRLIALLHDAPEYVIGDMISPFKAVVGGDYKAVELRLQHAIHLRFSLTPIISQELRRQIKRADAVAAYHEATLLAGFLPDEAVQFFGRPRGIDPQGLDLTPLPTQNAQNAFLLRFAALDQQRIKG